MDGDDTNNSDNESHPSVPTALAIPNRVQDALTECVQQIFKQENAGEQSQISVNVSVNLEHCENLQLGGTQQINTDHPDEKNKIETEMNPICRFAKEAAKRSISRIKDSRVFVKTSLLKKIEYVLRNFSTTFIIGNPGQGKTKNCNFLLYSLDEGKIEGFGNGWELYIITQPNDFKNIFTKSKKQVILIEDFLGRTHLIEGYLQEWIELFELMQEDLMKRKTLILFTSRKHIFIEAYGILSRYESICGKDHIVDLTDIPLDREERREILLKYLKEAGIQTDIKDYVSPDEKPIANSTISENTISRILDCEEVNILGFPFCCSTFVSHRTLLLKKEQFFKKPTLWLANEIATMSIKEGLKYVVLVYIFLSGGYLNTKELDEFSVSPEDKMKLDDIARACGQGWINLQMIREAADSLVGSFLTTDGIVFKYIHESLMDAVCIYFGKNHTKKSLEHCSVDVLLEFVGRDRMITVSGRESEAILIERLFDALSIKDYADKIMCHQFFDDNNFVTHFFEVMEKSERLTKVIIVKGKSKNSFLFWACKLGRIQLMDCLLKAGAHAHEKNCYGRNVLHLACCNDNLQVINRILEHFDGSLSDIISMPDGSGKTPLHLACEQGRRTIVVALIDHGAKSAIHVQDKSGRTPLHLACGHSQMNVAEFLSVLDILFSNGAESDIDKADKFGKTPLHKAAIHGQVEVMQKLLSNTTNLAYFSADRGARTPLHLACKHNCSETAELLIKYMHDNMLNDYITDKERRTPLHSACAGGGVDTVAVLLRNGYGKYIHRTDKTMKTPLHLACINGVSDVVEMLLNYGAKQCLDSRDKDGNTPLHLACKYVGSIIVRMLLKQGANINSKNYLGRTALDLASKRNSHSLVDALMQERINVEMDALTVKSPSENYN